MNNTAFEAAKVLHKLLPSAPDENSSFQEVSSFAESACTPEPSPPTCMVGRAQGLHTEGDFQSIKSVGKVSGAEGKVGVISLNIRGIRGKKTKDKDIIQYLVEQRFLTKDQIERFFFGGNRGSAFRALTRLEQGRFLYYQNVTYLDKRFQLVRPAARAALVYQEYIGAPPKLKQNVNSSTLMHDSRVTEVRQKFSKVWKAKWISEAFLKETPRIHVPDGVLRFQDTGTKVAIEFENSKKSAELYEKAFNAYDRDSFKFVIYVCADQSLTKKIKNEYRYNKVRFSIGVFNWEELRAGSPKLWTPKGERDILKEESL